MSRVSSAGSGRTSIGLVQFPGSNCDMDCIDTLKRHFNIVPKLIWHSESTLPPVDAIVLPGGFSFGDYLRSGALASHSPVMAAVIAGIGCRQGLEVGGDVESLGRRVTAAVVHAIFSIILIDALFALLYMKLDV